MSQRGLQLYLNGRFVPEQEAVVSVYDRCFLYGDGVFEGIAVWKRTPFRLDAHLQRMEDGLAYLQIANPLSREQWAAVLDEIIARNDMEDGYLRVQLSRGEGMSSIKWEPRLLRRAEPNVVVIPVPGFRDYYKGLFAQKLEQGLRAIIVSRPRIPSAAIPAGIKHCNYLNSVLGAMEVTASGADIGIAVDAEGFVTEGIVYNIFMVKDGRLRTAPLSRDLLPGITREVVIEVARAAGYPVSEEVFGVFDLTAADEAFICSTLELAVPVVEIAGRKIGGGTPGPITRRLGQLLLEEMEAEAARHASARPAKNAAAS
jgi:branched-chain amino acid aminotransferase